jgi:hypothetical protein
LWISEISTLRLRGGVLWSRATDHRSEQWFPERGFGPTAPPSPSNLLYIQGSFLTLDQNISGQGPETGLIITPDDYGRTAGIKEELSLYLLNPNLYCFCLIILALWYKEDDLC